MQQRFGTPLRSVELPAGSRALPSPFDAPLRPAEVAEVVEEAAAASMQLGKPPGAVQGACSDRLPSKLAASLQAALADCPGLPPKQLLA